MGSRRLGVLGTIQHIMEWVFKEGIARQALQVSKVLYLPVDIYF